jgi:plasmid stabilization system protein ParE
MVKYKVLTTAEAADQLQNILDYITETDSLGKARIVSKGILGTIKSLKSFPNGYSIYRTIKETKFTYRSIPKWNYLIIYRVEEDPPKVLVVTIASARQSKERIEQLLK